ncbi:MAG: response regulator [Aquabacterium sp.]|uniref:response regulator transcription factor n=1 Tax=Aquabacterium sp. TaxID=1872578 RepID=UPI00272718DB|nr:response regulator [Aquabacterium sp.]MDO9005807.1 response regulator [Aquabacterium sp.]
MKAPTVFIVDDDDAVRDGLGFLLETAGYRVQSFSSAEGYLQTLDPAHPGCLLLDLRLPGMQGAQLQAELNQRGAGIPIIFLSAHGDIPTTVRTIQAGALDFLTKPIEGGKLLERVARAMEVDTEQRCQEEELRAKRQVFARLSERERDVLALAINGVPNKEIARTLGISHRTVEVHRSRILLKTNTATVLELAALAKDCGHTKV